MTGILDPETERRLAEGAERLRLLVEAGDPEIIEDLRSLNESADYMVRMGDASEPVDCERCRTPVVAVSEALGAFAPGSRKWKRAIWETEMARKHTLRRCEAIQRRHAAEGYLS